MRLIWEDEYFAKDSIMEIDRSSNGNKTPRPPGNVPSEHKDALSLPRVKTRDPFPEFPAKMLLAVDGWGEIEKTATGEWLAKTLGGVLVDSGQFYRALTKACGECGVDVGDSAEVADFCQRVTLHTWLGSDGARVQEAQVAVNDRWFSKVELADVSEPTTQTPAFTPIREKVNEALRGLDFDRRVVMVGLDIGVSVFPNTPYKFFLDSTEVIRHQSELEILPYPKAGNPDRRKQHHCVTSSWNGFKVLMIDTVHVRPLDAGPLILAETVLRAMELGVYGRSGRARQRLKVTMPTKG